MGAEEVEIFSDSRLVVSQVEGSFELPYVVVLEVVRDTVSMFSKGKCG